MDKLFDYFVTNIVPKFALTWQPIVIFIIMLIMALTKFLAKNSMHSAMIIRLQKWLHGMSKDDLLFNDFFFKDQEYLLRINQIFFDNDDKKLKAKVFKIVLKAKLKSDLATVRDFLTAKEYDVSGSGILAHKFGSLVNRLINNADAEIRTELQKEYGNAIGGKLFNFIMFTKDGWAERRDERVEHLFAEIDILRESNAFDNNIERTDHFISAINVALRSAIFTAERSFRIFNGGIAKIVESGNVTI